MTIQRIDEAHKADFRALLLLADPEWAAVEKYLHDGEMYALFVEGRAAAEIVVTERADSHCEIKNLATDPAFWRRGYARALVDHVAGLMAGRYEKLYVGTSGPALYERMGFTPAYTVKNFFVDNYSDPVWDEGALCVDMYYLVRDLKGERP